jgi:hypothetical protein
MAKERAGQERTGQGKSRTGQDRTGQDRTGQDRTGQERTVYHAIGHSSETEQQITWSHLLFQSDSVTYREGFHCY